MFTRLTCIIGVTWRYTLTNYYIYIIHRICNTFMHRLPNSSLKYSVEIELTQDLHRVLPPTGEHCTQEQSSLWPIGSYVVWSWL